MRYKCRWVAALAKREYTFYVENSGTVQQRNTELKGNNDKTIEIR